MTRCQVCDAPTNGYLCKPCLGEISRALGDWQSLMHEASVLATGGARTYRHSARRPYSDEELAELDEEYAHRMAAIPARLRSRDGRLALPGTPRVVNLDARELLADAYDTLRGQIDDLRDLANTEPAGWGDAVPWLLRNLDHVRHHPGAASIHDELTFMHDRMQRAVDRSPEWIYAGPCTHDTGDQCCARELYYRPGTDEIECKGYRSDGIGCGTVYTYAERQEWLLASVSTALLPLEMWRTALPKLFPQLTWPNRSTWFRWERSQRITREGSTETGLAVYRGGELIDLVVSEQPRIVGNANKKNRRCA